MKKMMEEGKMISNEILKDEQEPGGESKEKK